MECPQCDGQGVHSEESDPPDTYRGPRQYTHHTCFMCDGSGTVEHYCTGCGETTHDNDNVGDCPNG